MNTNRTAALTSCSAMDTGRVVFRGDHGVVGRMVQLNQHPFTILGVAPREFRGTELFFAPDFWVPVMNTEQVQGASSLNDRGSDGIWLVGHLKPGVTPAQATADLTSVEPRTNALKGR